MSKGKITNQRTCNVNIVHCEKTDRNAGGINCL